MNAIHVSRSMSDPTAASGRIDDWHSSFVLEERSDGRFGPNS
jgi:hypothetical protein